MHGALQGLFIWKNHSLYKKGFSNSNRRNKRKTGYNGRETRRVGKRRKFSNSLFSLCQMQVRCKNKTATTWEVKEKVEK